MAKKKSVPKKADKKKAASVKKVARPQAAARKAAVKPARKAARAKGKKKARVSRSRVPSPVGTISFERQGLGAKAGGQSGDIEGLREMPQADSESVEELAEEGQAFEAEAVSGVEDAPDPDEAEVTTHEILEDDVPKEYEDQD